MPDARQLTDKVAIVTGSGTGIGQSVAHAFAEAGAVVIVLDVDGSAARAVADEIVADGGTAEATQADVRRTETLGELMTGVAGRHGSLDVLVNNAGITIPGDLLGTTETNWDAIQNVNLKGSFFCMQAAARVMREQGSGAIINMASISGKGYRSTIAYAASKGGVVAMTRIAAQELGPFGVTVNALVPGFTADTSVMQRAIDALAAQRDVEADVIIDEIASVTARRRLVRPEEIAATAVFLAGPLATMITGQSINIDGGLVFD
jgi:NAD(P)-dependent dehydrogenase (short-subunit alcohol dehydrogenase family)